jgi:hypothetical protein
MADSSTTNTDPRDHDGRSPRDDRASAGRDHDEKTKEGARPRVANERKRERGRESAEAEGASERGEVDELGSPARAVLSRTRAPTATALGVRPDAAWLGATSKVAYTKMRCGACVSKNGIVDVGG